MIIEKGYFTKGKKHKNRIGVKSMRKQWTADEVDYLKNELGNISIAKISANLSRSVDSVSSKASKLGVDSKSNQEWLTVTDFCEASGIHRSTVDYWIADCKFPAQRKMKYRRVYPKSFWKWAESNKHRIQWNDFPTYALGPEPDWVAEVRKVAVKRTNKRRAWTKAEINELEYLLNKNKYTYPELTEMLNRSHGAIKRKIYDLRLPVPVYVNRHAVPEYTNEEIETAVSLYIKGYPLHEVAKKINRTEMGLRGKLERSGYKISGKKLIVLEEK